MNTARGLVEALDGFAKGVLPNVNLFRQAVRHAYERLDAEQKRYPNADLSLGYEFVEEIEALEQTASRGQTPAEIDFGYGSSWEAGAKRLSQEASEELSDYDLLQMLLSLQLTWVQAGTLSGALLGVLGGLGRVFRAPDELLLEVKGVDQNVLTLLRLVRACNLGVSRPQTGLVAIERTSQLFDYAEAAMGHLVQAELRVMFLNRRREMIGVEVLQCGSIDKVALYPREIMSRAFDLCAKYLVILHNQPFGDGEPSFADMQYTAELETVARGLDIEILDHLIVAPQICVSLREMGLMGGEAPKWITAPELIEYDGDDDVSASF
jgi:DNA repair protein RadC